MTNKQNAKLQNPEVVVLLAPGFEEIEAVTLIDLLRRADVHVETYGIGSGQIRGGHGLNIDADCIFKGDLPECEYLIVPGGLGGCEVISQHAGIAEIIRARHQEGKGLAAICAAPSYVLEPLGVLKDRSYTGYPMGDEMSRKCLEDSVVADGHVITSQAVGTAIDFALELIKKLRSPEQAQRIAEAILYRS